MPSYVFPGFPSFLEAAEAELGLPGSARPARRITALTDLANLCAQAAHGDPSRVEVILARAAEFRDQIATALRAAELMLAEVEANRRLPTTSQRSQEPGFSPLMEPRSGRKGTRNERVAL